VKGLVDGSDAVLNVYRALLSISNLTTSQERLHFVF
jgi:hypothetical protein